LPAEDTSFTGSYQNPEDMSAANLTITKFYEVGNNGDLRWLFFKDQCRHCKDPMCKEACPINAIKVKPNGIVFIRNKCTPTKPFPEAVVGVDYCSNDDEKPCQVGCPFKTMDYSHVGIPRYRKNDGTPLADGKMNKCDFCYDRYRNAMLRSPAYTGKFAKSKKPACQLACPTGAIITGEHVKMRRKANRRVRYLQANGYPNANRYPAGLPTQVIWVLLEDHGIYGVGEPSLPGA
jgi:formate dehydrogenase iron-sulfur subunit